MTTGSLPVSCEAIFGSYVRADRDRHSDIDYLIVDDDIFALMRRRKWLAERGFSVSEYTWRRLNKAFDARTLFAIHLKMESRIVLDRDSRLLELCAGLNPKGSYQREREDSLELLRPLHCVPNSGRGRAWALDVMAVAFRNAAILTLAEEGQFIFSTRELVAEFVRRGRISRCQGGTLLGLRKFKARYRASVDFAARQSDVDAGLSALSKAMRVDFDSSVQRSEGALACRQDSTHAYADSRSVEAELISVPARVLDLPEAQQLHRRLKVAVENPHGYLWRFMQRKESMREDLARLRAFY